MAVSGLPLKCERHAHNIANLCLDMQEIAKGIVINDRRVEVRFYCFYFFLASSYLINLYIVFVHINTLIRSNDMIFNNIVLLFGTGGQNYYERPLQN